jgi:succinate-acetate transporter protein
MFIGTLKHNTNSKITFGTLMVLFFLLAIGDFANSAVVTQIAGYVGIFGGASALYGAVAQILNEEYGKVVLPL